MLLTANPKGYLVIIAGDFSVHVAADRPGREETLGKFDWVNKMKIVSEFIICSSQNLLIRFLLPPPKVSDGKNVFILNYILITSYHPLKK